MYYACQNYNKKFIELFSNYKFNKDGIENVNKIIDENKEDNKFINIKNKNEQNIIHILSLVKEKNNEELIKIYDKIKNIKIDDLFDSYEKYQNR